MKILDSTTCGFEKDILRFKQRTGEVDEKTVKSVEEIIGRVRLEGDPALFELTLKFDRISMDQTSVEVSREEIERSADRVDPEALASLRASAARIQAFHEKQKEQTWTFTDQQGVTLGQIVRPLQRVGIYVPGGKASYPSSVLMNAIPARVAGVREVVMVSPTPGGEANPYVLAAARIAGVDRIFRVGGAQAVAALAYGTESVPKVDKIVGPGNIYVALAKKMLFGTVDIDMIAGPSEILVLADHTADPDFIASDMLSQAEHDEMAWTVLVTTSRDLIQSVQKAIKAQLVTLPRREIAEKALQNYGTLILVKDLIEGAEVANAIGPEHLEIMTEKPSEILERIENAGAIFLGPFSPEPIGDYMAGPNHVLPTSGTSRFFSPLCVGDFYKKSSLISFTREGFQLVADDTIRLAELEGLPGHARSVRLRKERLKNADGGL